MEIDWKSAPKDAKYSAWGVFYRENGSKLDVYNASEGWIEASSDKEGIKTCPSYTERPKEWPNEQRIDIIATNGGDGEHYQKAKHDSEKPRYDLLPPVAIDLMAQVMTFGAKKYHPEGWRTVPDAIQRYQAALLRHSFAMLRGEVIDSESGLPHAAHAMCCAAFIAELTTPA
jgi:hypothetical protein